MVATKLQVGIDRNRRPHEHREKRVTPMLEKLDSFRLAPPSWETAREMMDEDPTASKPQKSARTANTITGYATLSFEGLRQQYNDHDEKAKVNVCLYMLFEESDGQPAVPEDLEKRLTCSGCMLQLPDKVVLTRLITPQNDRKARIMRIA